MRRYLLACLAIFLLVFCAGLASRIISERFVRNDFNEQAQKVLVKSGVRKHEGHYFLAVDADQVESGQPIILDHVSGQVWKVRSQSAESPSSAKSLESASVARTLVTNGLTEEIPTLPAPVASLAGKVVSIKSPESTSKLGSAEMLISVTDRKALVNGELPSDQLKLAIERSLLSASHVDAVDNRISVNNQIATPVWQKSIPGFLTSYFSQAGAQGVAVDQAGVKLEGELLDVKARDRIYGEAKATFPAQSEFGNALAIKDSKPPILVLRGTGGNFQISGLLPDEDTRNKIVATIKEALPDQELDENIRIAGGVSKPWWMKNARTLIPVFLKETGGVGALEYWKSHLLVSGNVADESTRTMLFKTAKSEDLPNDFSVENDLAVTRDRTPSITIFRDTQKNLVLRGEVASSNFKDQILSALILRNPELLISDQLQISDEVQNLPWGSPGELITETMFVARNGEVNFSAEGVEVKGSVNSQDQKQRINELASKVAGSGSSVFNRLLVNETSSTKPLVSVPQSKGRFSPLAVYFSSGESAIRSSQYENIRNTASIIRGLEPDVKFIVGGYADHRGDQSFNRRLSLNRANAVREELVKLGVAGRRMEVSHFGEDVSNVRSSDLWKSRRVELSIVK